MTEELLEIIRKEVKSLEKSLKLLQDSYARCQKIDSKPKYSNEELEMFEALTARFSRLSDLLVQKIFRLIDTHELVNDGTLLDRINRAEKREIVPSAKQFKELRLLRNLIAREYEPDEYTRIFNEVLKNTPFLFECVEKTIHYCKRFD